MSNLNDKTDHLRNLQRELWARMRELNDIPLDPEAARLFPGGPPEWIDDAYVFGPIVAQFEQEIDALARKVRAKQQTLSELLHPARRSRKGRNYDDEMRQLEGEIQKLKNEISAMPSYSYSYGPDDGTQQFSNLEAQIDLMGRQAQDLEDEIQQLKVQLRDAIEEVTKAYETGAQFKQHFNKSRATIPKYHSALKMLEQTAADLNKNRQQLYDRGQKLAGLIQKMQFNKTDSEKRIRKLEEAFADHQQLVASYRLLEDRIKEQERQQEIALTKMVDAVELAEEGAAEAQKSRMTRDALAEELRRVKDLTENTVRQFGEAFTEHHSQITAHFEGIVDKIRGRSAILDAENEQLAREKENVQKQLEFARHENALLKSSRTDNGFSAFVDRMASLRAEIEAAYARKEQLVALNEKTELNTNELKSKLVLVSSTGRTEQVELSQRCQKLEMEVEMQKATSKDLLAKNARITGENQRLRNDILQIQRASTIELERRLKDKESELAEVKIQLEATEKSSAKAMTEMQKAVLAYRQHADKWKAKGQAIGLEASDARQTADGEQQQMMGEIARLEDELARRKQLRTKCELMLGQLDEQVKTLKTSVALANKKERHQAALMAQFASM
jgi:hypothetical protein